MEYFLEIQISEHNFENANMRRDREGVVATYEIIFSDL